MYGMIHQAARDMVLDRYGVDAWNTILASSGLDSRHLVSAEYFPDDDTYSLIRQIVTHSGLSRDDLLEQFGEHWIGYACGTSFAPILEMAGGDLVSLIRNLDRMHASISASLPRAAMPSFEVLAADETRIEVVYRSGRPGLGAFVKGLLRGLLTHFGETGDITTAPANPDCRSECEASTVYLITRARSDARVGLQCHGSK